ncbi:deaminase [Streptomyces cyaneofuscatus]|uniref:deaminase n=1 Tax=Streptomyces cyaneofuscatus TaxID=66883 RepID=UPI0036C8B014
MTVEDEVHRAHMVSAIDLARSGHVGGWQVGAIIARSDGSVISTGYRGEVDNQKHAEALAIEKAQAANLTLKGATAYVTLEPCANLASKNKRPCSLLLAENDISRVYIGDYDANPRIYRLGWRNLRDAGVELRDFPQDLRADVQQLRPERQADFRERRGGLTGRASFDYTQRDGKYDVYLRSDGDSPRWSTRWSQRDADSIYANPGVKGVVAEARFAHDFSEIDDPGVFDFESHFTTVTLGGIAVFRNNFGYLLVKILEIRAGPERGSDHFALKFEYEIRPFVN